MPADCSATAIFCSAFLWICETRLSLTPSSLADFLHGHVVGVVQEDHLLVAIGQRASWRRTGVICNSSAGAHAVGFEFRRWRRNPACGRARRRSPARCRHRAHSAQFQQHAVPALGPMPIGSATSASLGVRPSFIERVARRGIHLLLPAAQVARRPVELPQAVEDGALDAVLGVAWKATFFSRRCTCPLRRTARARRRAPGRPDPRAPAGSRGRESRSLSPAAGGPGRSGHAPPRSSAPAAVLTHFEPASFFVLFVSGFRRPAPYRPATSKGHAGCQRV